MNPFLFFGLATILLVVFYFLFRRPAGTPDQNASKEEEEELFVFDPDVESLKRMTRRKVTISAPAQTIGGVRRKLIVEANPLPNLPDLEAPGSKGIDKLLVLVIDDRVRTKDTKEEVYEFNTPLTYTIEYTAADAAATTPNPDGTPRLSIVTGYLSDTGWKFERLATTVSPNPKSGGGALTARVRNLQPQDPKWIGIP